MSGVKGAYVAFHTLTPLEYCIQLLPTAVSNAHCALRKAETLLSSVMLAAPVTRCAFYTTKVTRSAAPWRGLAHGNFTLTLTEAE